MKKIFLKIVIGVVLACILFVCFLYTNNEIGVTSSKLEADIRSSQKIKDDWTVDGSVSSTMAAYISYPQDLSDHSFSVYVNRPGLSFGYFFRGGGNLSGVQRGIAEYTVEGYNERAFISMNQQQVTQLEIDDGNTIQVLDIDSNKPFAIVLPISAGTITFYDVNGNKEGLKVWSDGIVPAIYTQKNNTLTYYECSKFEVDINHPFTETEFKTYCLNLKSKGIKMVIKNHSDFDKI